MQKTEPKEKRISALPEKTGVYFFLDKNGKTIYVGKAVNIKTRVASHFSSKYFNTAVLRTAKIKWRIMNSEIEALIEEARLIKALRPKYNTLLKDDKNFFYLVATREVFPRILLTHQPNPKKHAKIVGPFTDGKAVKKTLALFRRALPWRSCRAMPKKPCMYYYIEKCPAPCAGKTKVREYGKAVGNLFSIFEGKKPLGGFLRELDGAMKREARRQNFERAAKLRDSIFYLRQILKHKAYLSDVKEQRWEKTEQHIKTLLRYGKNAIGRIEAYDVSNISGRHATASMVVFEKGAPAKHQYRKFRIIIKDTPDDIAMLKEAIARRLRHDEWGLPDIMLIDGGKGHRAAAQEILKKAGIKKKIFVLALAKRHETLYIAKDRAMPLRMLPEETEQFFTCLRDEAHRFAKTYHLNLRKKHYATNAVGI